MRESYTYSNADSTDEQAEFKPYDEEPEQYPGERQWLRACLRAHALRHHRPPPPKYGPKPPIRRAYKPQRRR